MARNKHGILIAVNTKYAEMRGRKRTREQLLWNCYFIGIDRKNAETLRTDRFLTSNAFYLRLFATKKNIHIKRSTSHNTSYKMLPIDLNENTNAIGQKFRIIANN